MTDPTTHDAELFSTINDDGIWLRCTCGWEKNVGYTPDLNDVNQVWVEHQPDLDPNALQEAIKAAERFAGSLPSTTISRAIAVYRSRNATL